MENGTGENVSKRNNAFEFYRFLFACILVVVHVRRFGDFGGSSWAFGGGYLCVEFFFILSGFLLMDKVRRGQRLIAQGGVSPERLTASYFAARYRKLMPTYWLAWAVLLVVDCIVYPGFNVKSTVFKGLSELFGVQVFWRPEGLNGQLWFISALLWASALVYYLLLKHEDFSLYILFPLGLLTAFGYLYKTVGHIDVTDNGTFYLAPFVRAFFEIGFGCVLHQVYVEIRERSFNRYLMSVIEIVLTVSVLAIMWNTYKSYMDFVVVFLIGGLVLATALNRGIMSSVLNNRLSEKLGEITYTMYINQLIIIRVMARFYEVFPWKWVTIVTVFVTMVMHGLSQNYSSCMPEGSKMYDWSRL